jgi:hypothetical protein
MSGDGAVSVFHCADERQRDMVAAFVQVMVDGVIDVSACLPTWNDRLSRHPGVR